MQSILISPPLSLSLYRKCALSGQTKPCKHRIKFGDSSLYYYVSPFCRYRVSGPASLGPVQSQSTLSRVT